MTSAAILVVAKAPVAGLAKTRLAASVGDQTAAELAAAALLDTLDVCAATFDTCLLALTGDVSSAVLADSLVAALEGWTVFPQRGAGFAERLVHAHVDAAQRSSGPVLQVGMDTPQMQAAQLTSLDSMLCEGACDAVLAPAVDGGWWALGVHTPELLAGLGSVAMSTDQTYLDTLRLLREAGATVGTGEQLRDVDEAEDAHAVSIGAPDLRFSSRWGTR